MNVHLAARLLNADWRNIFYSFSGISTYEGGIMKVYHRNFSVSGEAVFSFYVKPGFNYSMQVRYDHLCTLVQLESVYCLIFPYIPFHTFHSSSFAPGNTDTTVDLVWM